jgi:general stress protein YciG
VKEEKGPQVYEDIGHKGGEKVRDEKGPESYSEISHKRGENEKDDKPQESGRKLRPHEETGGLGVGAAECAGVKLPSYKIVAGMKVERDVDYLKAVGYEEPAFPESTISIVSDSSEKDWA